LAAPGSRRSRRLTQIAEEVLHCALCVAVVEDLSDQVHELWRHPRPAQRKPFDDVAGKIHRLREETTKRLANRGAVDDPAPDVQLCGDLNGVRRLDVEVVAESQHDRHGGMALAKTQQLAFEGVDVPGARAELDAEYRARAELPALDVIRVDRAAEVGVRRGGDGNRE